MKLVSTRPGGGRRRLAALVTVTALAAAGCDGRRYDAGQTLSDGYRTNHPIVLTEAPETMDIAVGFGGTITASTRDSVRAFAADATARGTSGLLILTPQGAANDLAASYVAGAAQQAAIEGGLPPSLIQRRAYAVGDPNAAAPVRLSYNRIRAVTGPCGQWTEDLRLNEDENLVGSEFGCATQANFAAMVSNPQDLLGPRAATGIPAGRRTVAIADYVANGNGVAE